MQQIIIEYSKKPFTRFFIEQGITIGNSSMDIIMDNQVLTKVNSTKYLGIIVDHKLNWIDHITYHMSKLRFLRESASCLKQGNI